MPAGKGKGVIPGQTFDNADHFLQPPGPASGRYAGGLPFPLLFSVESAAYSGGNQQPPPGNQVNGGQGLRQQYGMAQGRQQHRRAQPHPFRNGGHGGQGSQRLHTRLGGEAVADPHRIQSSGFPLPRQSQNPVGVSRRRGGQQQPPGRQQIAQL